MQGDLKLKNCITRILILDTTGSIEIRTCKETSHTNSFNRTKHAVHELRESDTHQIILSRP